MLLDVALGDDGMLFRLFCVRFFTLEQLWKLCQTSKGLYGIFRPCVVFCRNLKDCQLQDAFITRLINADQQGILQQIVEGKHILVQGVDHEENINIALHKAVDQFDLPRVLACLVCGANINALVSGHAAQAHAGVQALLRAFFPPGGHATPAPAVTGGEETKGRIQTAVKLLLFLKADPNIILMSPGAESMPASRGHAGCSPLHLAIIKEHTTTVETLVKAKADPNVRDEKGNTPLHLSAAKGDTKAAEALVKANADPNVQNAQYKTALQLAEEADYGRGHSEVAKVLCKHGARGALCYAAKNNLQDMVTELISNGHDLEECDKALVRAGEAGHREVVGVLMAAVIAAGKDVNACLQDSGAKTLLMYASKVGHEGFVRVLIEKGASLDTVDTSGRPALQLAVEPTPDGSRGHSEVVGVLIAAALAAGHDVNACLGSKARPGWHTSLNIKP